MIIIYEDIKIITKFSVIVSLDIGTLNVDPTQAHSSISFLDNLFINTKVWGTKIKIVMKFMYNIRKFDRKSTPSVSSKNG